ncbi:hypothetical protein A2U01_0059011, partial [Trifolium medium]|nr:hypothetical protein [Trifolium medium]
NLNQPSQPVVVEAAVPASQGGLSAPNAIWPPFGLPIGYTSSGYVPTSIEVQPGPQNVQVPLNHAEIPNGQTRVPPVQPGLISSQESLEDPRNAYQGPEIPNDGTGVNFVVPQPEEAQQKFKAIEDRL